MTRRRPSSASSRIWGLVEEPSQGERWDWLARRVLAFFQDQTLSNENGVSVVLGLLGVEDPWRRIASRAGQGEQDLRKRIQAVVARRNAIIHQADRPIGDPDGPPTPISYAWTRNHIGAVETIAEASYDLVAESSQRLASLVVDAVTAESDEERAERALDAAEALYYNDDISRTVGRYLQDRADDG